MQSLDRSVLPFWKPGERSTLAAGEIEGSFPQAKALSVKLGYRPALDGVRGVAVLMVMLDHAGSFVWHSELLSGGGFGVDIFFVLSGFLITEILLEEWNATNRISLKRFYLRRALRLLPAMFLVLIVSASYALYCGLRSNDSAAVIGIWKSILFTLVYIPNFALAFGWTGYNLLAHTWSLGIEEQFYFLWPICLICLLRLRLNLHRIGWILAVGVGLVIINRLILLWTGTSPDVLYLRPDTRADSLLIGCVAAALWHGGSRRFFRWYRYSWLAVGAIAIIAAFRPHLNYALPLGLYTILAVSAAIVILGLLDSQRPTRLWQFPPLVYAGRISYGLYLWHLPVYSLGAPLLVRWRVASGLQLLTLFTLTFIVAVISFRFVEQPCLRLKTRFSVTS